MSILDTFFILFESDASKLDKGLKDTERKADGLKDKLKDTDVVAGKLGGSLIGALAGLAGAALAAVSFSAMTREIMAAASAADKLNETAARLEINIEALSAWGDLVKKNGGSTEAFAASIEGLNRQLAQVEVTGKSRAAPFLKELGIDLDDVRHKGKSAMDFLPELADAFAGLGSQKSIALGSRLGLDQSTIMTLQAGRRAVEELLEKEKELGVVTKRQGEIADAFGDQMDDTRHAFRSVWMGIMEHVLPPLTWMAEKLQQFATFMRKHSDFAVGLMIAIGAAVTVYALPPLVSMAAAAVIAFAPFLIATAIIAAVSAAFALLYDDVQNFIAGNDSLIGQILEKYPLIGEIVKSIGTAFAQMWQVAKAVGAGLVAIWTDPLSAFEAFTGALREGMKIAGDFIIGIWDAIVGKILGAIESIKSGARKLGSLVGLGGVSETAAAVAAGQVQLGIASSSPLAAQTSNSIANSRTSNRSTSVQIDKVEVKTQVTDAAGISKAIGGSLESQMRQAASNYDDGVLA